jgi:hypothetical protein
VDEFKTIGERLTSDDLKEVSAALTELFPDDLACLISSREGKVSMCSREGVDANALFVSMLACTQNLGRQLGLELDFTPLKKPGSGLVLATDLPGHKM